MSSNSDVITFRISICYAVLALLVFSLFILTHPLDWQQPETLNLHYYSLQSGLDSGPLTSGLSVIDLLKPLNNNARGGSYQARYWVELLDGLKVKAYQQIYKITGPFLGEPLAAALIIIAVVFLILAIYEWFHSLPAALISGGTWLLTSHTLLDARYPARPNMVLATALVVYIIWEFLRLQRIKKGGNTVIRISCALFIVFGVHEQTVCLIPSLIVIIIWNWKSYRSNLIILGIGIFGALAAYIVFFWVLTPLLMKNLIGKVPLMLQLNDSSPLLLLNPLVLWSRFCDLTVPGIAMYSRLNLGFGLMIPGWERIISGISFLILLLITLPRGFRSFLLPLLVSVIFFITVTIVMFPFTPSSVEMPVYYFAVAGILFFFPLGALLAALRREKKYWKWLVVCVSLAAISAVNLHIAAKIMDDMPGDFGFNLKSRIYTGDILTPDCWTSSGEVPSPSYIAYPRPRYFDISTKWDLMLRVWHGESERVFSLIMPVLHLGRFESGQWLGNPEEFAVFAGTQRDKYEARAVSFVDMVERGWYDLLPIKDQGIATSAPPEWSDDNDRRVRGKIEETIAGRVYRSVLPAGDWSLDLPIPAGVFPGWSVLVIVRGDLQPAGSDRIYYRTSPLAEKICRVIMKTGQGEKEWRHTYGWSYQLYYTVLPLRPEKDMGIEVDSGGNSEILGPIFLPPGLLKIKTFPVPRIGEESPKTR